MNPYNTINFIKITVKTNNLNIVQPFVNRFTEIVVNSPNSRERVRNQSHQADFATAVNRKNNIS